MIKEWKELEESIDYRRDQLENKAKMRNDNVAHVTMIINIKTIQNAMLDVDSRVNVIVQEKVVEMGLKWEPISFNICMVDNRTMILRVIIKHVKMSIINMEFPITLLVLTMLKLACSYKMLLGRL